MGFKDMATKGIEKLNLLFAITPRSVDTSSHENHRKYPHSAYIDRNQNVSWRTFFVADSIGVSSFVFTYVVSESKEKVKSNRCKREALHNAT